MKSLFKQRRCRCTKLIRLSPYISSVHSSSFPLTRRYMKAIYFLRIIVIFILLRKYLCFPNPVVFFSFGWYFRSKNIWFYINQKLDSDYLRLKYIYLLQSSYTFCFYILLTFIRTCNTWIVITISKLKHTFSMLFPFMEIQIKTVIFSFNLIKSFYKVWCVVISCAAPFLDCFLKSCKNDW